MIIANSLLRTFNLRGGQNKTVENNKNNNENAGQNVNSTDINTDKSQEMLEKSLLNQASYNMPVRSDSKTNQTLFSGCSVLKGLISTSTTLASGVFNSLSKTSLSVMLSALGFDSRNLNLSELQQVNILKYFASIMQKSLPELTESLTSTILKDALSGNQFNMIGDVANTLTKEILGAELSSVDSSAGEIDSWSLSTVRSIISSKSLEEQQHILDSIVEQAPYLLNGEYKKDAEGPDSIPDDMMQTAKNCIAVSIYDNIGLEGILNQEPWEIISHSLGV